MKIQKVVQPITFAKRSEPFPFESGLPFQRIKVTSRALAFQQAKSYLLGQKTISDRAIYLYGIHLCRRCLTYYKWPQYINQKAQKSRKNHKIGLNVWDQSFKSLDYILEMLK